jgi:hypothetical protein
MTKKLTAIIGFHNTLHLKLASDIIEMYGYNTIRIKTPNEMLALAKEREFNAYHWDVNLGKPGSIDISFSEIFWPLIKVRYESGQVKALASTNTEKAIEIARARGIPCEDKMKVLNTRFSYFKLDNVSK